MVGRSRGFTLVELSIVLIIIRILIGFILKGQELIRNAQIKRTYRTYLELVATFVFGGPIGVGYITFQGVTLHWIAFKGVPNNIARDVDLKYDDGLYNSGAIRAENDYTATTGDNTLYFKFK